MSLKFSSANVVYVKNLSPLATEEIIRSTFGACDEILKVEFKLFPGSNQRYCQIEFKTSAGITNSSNFSNKPLLGVPMTITVIDPVGPNASGLPFSISGAQGQNSLLEIAMHSHMMNVQAVQSAAVQAKILAERRMSELGIANQTLQNSDGLLSPYLLSMSNNQRISSIPIQPFDTSESEEHQIQRTILVDNIPDSYTVDDVRKMFSGVGTVTNIRVDTSEAVKGARFALVEFSSIAYADTAKKIDGVEASGRTLRVKKAETTVHPRDSVGMRFDILASGSHLPGAYQQIQKVKMEEKMAAVRQMQEKLAKRLTNENTERKKRDVSRDRSPDRFRNDRGRFYDDEFNQSRDTSSPSRRSGRKRSFSHRRSRSRSRSHRTYGREREHKSHARRKEDIVRRENISRSRSHSRNSKSKRHSNDFKNSISSSNRSPETKSQSFSKKHDSPHSVYMEVNATEKPSQAISHTASSELQERDSSKSRSLERTKKKSDSNKTDDENEVPWWVLEGEKLRGRMNERNRKLSSRERHSYSGHRRKSDRRYSRDCDQHRHSPINSSPSHQDRRERSSSNQYKESSEEMLESNLPPTQAVEFDPNEKINTECEYDNTEKFKLTEELKDKSKIEALSMSASSSSDELEMEKNVTSSEYKMKKQERHHHRRTSENRHSHSQSRERRHSKRERRKEKSRHHRRKYHGGSRSQSTEEGSRKRSARKSHKKSSRSHRHKSRS